MSDINWEEFLFGSEPVSFLLEILFRTTIMYVVILIALRSSGRRGVKQLSVFETVIIVGLGTAAGDPMIYKEIGVISSLTVFVVIIGLYRLTIYATSKSNFIEKKLEGEPRLIIKSGRFSLDGFDRENLSQDEFFAELRMQNVEHLGQIKSAILETSGEVSILFRPEDSVTYGLPLLINLKDRQITNITDKGQYACTYCGNVEELQISSTCKICHHEEWVEAINTLRIS